MKKYVFVCLTIAMLLWGTSPISATEPVEELSTGLMEPEVVDVLDTETEDVEVIDRETSAQPAQAVECQWDKYRNYYYYNLLDDDLRAVWDSLDEVCKAYYAEGKSVENFYENSAGDSCGRTEWVSLPKPMKAQDLRNFWCVYIYSNPQYYFLSNSYVRSYSSEQTGNETEYNKIALGVYMSFWDEGDRQAATEQVQQQLAAWQSEIDACASDEEKLQKIQDIICAKVTYNYVAAEGNVAEENSFSQSPYSVICGESTVCAGYADTFYMLCNAAGMDAISVTSSNHQWNKVRVNNTWYNFDLTWDDNYTESWEQPVYLYHGRSDAQYDTDIGSGTQTNIDSHQEEAYWESYIPLCTQDSNPQYPYSEPGVFAVSSEQTATPDIEISYDEAQIQVSVTCDSAGATVYYTLDGTMPSAADTKSYKYEDVLVVEPDTQIKAIAVCDGLFDSKIAEETTTQLEEYAVSYVLGGGTNDLRNPAAYTWVDAFTLYAPSKVGYHFAGWYIDEMYGKKVTEIAAGSVGAKTFYAKWEPITYKIAYNGNGATGGSTATQNGCKYDAAVSLAVNNYVRSGYTFTGWNTKADGSGTAYKNGASVKNMTATDGATITLYAQWKVNAYTIKYVGNKATKGSMAAQTGLLYGTSYKLTANKFKRTGYTFKGWNTKKNGKGASYKNKASVKSLTSVDGATITLYAQWKANKYTIKFSGNGATGGSMKKIKNRSYGTKYKLPANKFKKKGYKFVGWNTKKNGKGKMYKNKASVKNLTSKNGKTVTLYAQWKKK